MLNDEGVPLLLPLVLIVAPRDQRDVSVRVPGELGHARPKVREPPRLAARERHRVKLRLFILAPFGQKSESGPIRGEARVRVCVARMRELHPLPRARVVEEEVADVARRLVFLALLIGWLNHGVYGGGAFPVQVELGVGDEGEVEEALCFEFRHSALYRTWAQRVLCAA